MISDGRKLTYDFIELPHHLQTMVGRQMDFAPRAENESDMDCFTRWFKEARERGVIDKLRDFVTSAVEITGRAARK